MSLTPSRGVAQSGSALAWGARGRVFESLRPDHLFLKKSSHLAVTGFFYDLLFLRGADFCPTFCPTEDFDYPLVEREGN